MHIMWDQGPPTTVTSLRIRVLLSDSSSYIVARCCARTDVHLCLTLWKSQDAFRYFSRFFNGAANAWWKELHVRSHFADDGVKVRLWMCRRTGINRNGLEFLDTAEDSPVPPTRCAVDENLMSPTLAYLLYQSFRWGLVLLCRGSA